MKKILSLCINLLLLIISDAVPLKLIAGDRSVVKKDGATHTISKYYVVPNDYDPNNVTDTTAQTVKASLRSLYSESMGSGSIDEQISEHKDTTVNNQLDSDVTVKKNNDQVNFRSDLNVGQGEDTTTITNQPDDSTESTVSVSTEQTLDAEDLGINLQVAPISNPINTSHIVTAHEIDTNVTSVEAVQNSSAFIVDNVTDFKNIEDTFDDLLLSKLGIAVRYIYSQNLESFWKLIKINIDKELGEDELLARIEQLSLLLNIFTNLYEAAQWQQPVEKMIDGIVEILQKPFVEKNNRKESQAETNISRDYNEECLRKCQRSSYPHLDSNSTYLSETEASDSLELENWQRRQIADSDDKDLIKMSDDPDSNQVTVSHKPTNVPRSQLPVPYNLNVGVTDGYNALFSMTTPTLNDVARYNDIQEDPNSIQNIPDSTETVKNLDDQPGTVKSRTADDLPWTSEDKTTEYFPWPISTTPNDDLPWHIEDKKHTDEHRTSNKVPWTMSMDHVTTIGDNILLNPNQSIKSTVHSVKNGIRKPYHIYTYVINPTATLDKVANTGNFVQTVSRQPYEHLETTLYGLPTLHGGNKGVYKNQLPQSHYESQYSLSKPTDDISRQPSYSQVTQHVTTTYDQRHEVNPSTLHSQNSQEDNEPQYLIGSEPHHKPALLQSNTHPSESQPNSGEEKKELTIPEIDSPLGDRSLGNTEPVSTASVTSSSGDSRNVNPDVDDRHTKPNSYYPYENENQMQPSSSQALLNKASAHSSVQTSQYPGLISASASSSTYTNGLDEPVYGRQVYQQPGAISTTSANFKYTIAQNDNDVPTLVHGGDTNNYPRYKNEPVYGEQVYQQPGPISTASANSKFTIAQNDYDVPNLVHGGDTNNYPGYISKTTAHTEYTNEPIDYGHDTNTQPGLISEVHQHPVYPNVVNDFDDSIPFNGVKMQKHPGYISKASAYSKFTLPVNYNVPTHYDDYKVAKDIHPVKIQNVPDYPGYTDDVNHYIKVNPVNDGATQNVDNYLVPYQPYGHTVHVTHQPSLIETISGTQNLKLASTYRLFTLQNLQNLENAIIKSIQMHRCGACDNRVLISLKNIINVILLFAENLEKTDGTSAWYEKIFYNSQHSQHPLQHYVYNLIRQRWLHELMLVMYKNNFNINILQNPGIFSFLKSWQLPKYVQNFMKTEELKHVQNPQNYNYLTNSENDLQHEFSIHTYDDLLEVPADFAKYVTKNVIDSYKTRNEGIVLSIAGVEAEPDANAIINILQNYLHYKNYIETQENGVIRDNKVDMLKQVILFLSEKGYGPKTIADLIRKLYTAFYSIEGEGCKTHQSNFAKNMYDVILPVLRRSGR